MLQTPAGAIREVPVATVNLAGRHVTPVGGGAYLRLLPYRYTAAGIRRINEQEGEPACIYFHPWKLIRPAARGLRLVGGGAHVLRAAGNEGETRPAPV